MLIVALGRMAAAVPVLLGVSIVVFSMIHLVPGDAVDVIADEMLLPREAREQLRRQLGLDRPLLEQYFDWVGSALQGDLGRSIRTNRSVADDIFNQLPKTVELALASAVVGTVVGGALGIVGALHFRRWPDSAARLFSLVGVSMPNFWLGILLILLFAVVLRWLPIGGQGSLAHLVLPAITLGVAMAAIIARTLRASLLETLRTDYVRTAYSKGVGRRIVLWRHAIRNALIPTVTILGLQIGFLVSGALVVETVFSRQGLGRLTVLAIQGRDFPMIQGAVLVSAVGYVLINLAVDLSYLYLDPRLRRK